MAYIPTDLYMALDPVREIEGRMPELKASEQRAADIEEVKRLMLDPGIPVALPEPRDYEIGDTVVEKPGFFMPGTPATITDIATWGSPAVEWATFGRGAGTMVVPSWKLKKFTS